ncbi:DUF2185 domain-containing protein [Pseudoxanthomonas wuyuanensis]|uniref:DUF2185 domain-containing protein n=1 Tax=Pseudoxanthomonas wuyuanensis TaxID=1073196 RepID=UPI000BE264B7|nr:DUF2185 domain-containing protein [Pseudoxanthomonas wuyuanensis]
MKIGYVTVSNRVMVDGRRVSYLYREEPDNEDDSGWRIFSGDETQEYAGNPANFSLYNASTLIEVEPALLEVLSADYPIAFERDEDADDFIEVHSGDDP